MIEISSGPWEVMAAHARECYPRECCGIMLGKDSQVTMAIACRNSYEGDRKDRFVIDNADQIAADKKARELGLDVLGFFHSHPDEASYFSETDLKHSWPFFANVVISVRKGEVQDAKAFRVDVDQTAAEPEELKWPKS